MHARQVGLSGLAAPGMDIEGLTELESAQQWTAQIAQWKQAVESLADEFLQGQAANQIWNRNDLLYCDVLPFLRLFQEDLQDNGGEV
nr:hypothetical protein [Alcaligenes sp. HPC1271]